MKKQSLIFFLLYTEFAFTNYIPSLYISYDSISKSEFSEATFKFVDSPLHVQGFKNTNDFETTGSIRIRGNSTGAAPKKPYNIAFPQKINFLGMGSAKKWVLLSNPFDPTLIRNKLIFDLAGKLPFEFSSKSYFIDVWTNGTFDGSYQLTQKIDFSKKKINYDSNKGDFLFERDEKRNKKEVFYFYSPIDSVRISLNEPEQPTEEQQKDLSEKLFAIETAIATRNIDEYIKYVDLQTMIDYYWIEEFVNDPDLHTGSIYFTIHNGILRGGPVWDFDLALGNTSSEAKSKTTGFNAKKFWWGKLFKDPIFSKIASERYLELSPYFENMAQDNELGGNQIDSLLFYFKDSFERNFSNSGWAYCSSITDSTANARELTCPYNPIPKFDFNENIEALRTWIINRNTYIKSKAEQSLKDLDSIKVTLKDVLKKQDSIFAVIDSIAAEKANSKDSIVKSQKFVSYYSMQFSSPQKVFLYLKEKSMANPAKREGHLVKGTRTQSNKSKVIVKSKRIAR